MEFVLRPAVYQDTPAIYELARQGRINPTGLKWERFIVAETPESQIIACGQIKPHRDGSQELASIVVTKEWRHRGVARAIIEELIAGFDGPLYLMCRSSIGPMYEKFGFRVLEEDQMPKYFRRVSKLAGVLDALRKEGEYLLVMGRKPGRYI